MAAGGSFASPGSGHAQPSRAYPLPDGTLQRAVRPISVACFAGYCGLSPFLVPRRLAMTRDNAAVFFFGQAPSAEQVAAMAEGAHVSIERDERYARVRAEWPDVTATVAIDPHWNREVQISGMRAWIDQFSPELLEPPRVRSFLADLDRTTTCYGTNIEPAYDARGKVVAMLLRLVSNTGGFFFSHQSFYDSQGRRLFGLPGDPERLGSRKTDPQQ